MVQNLEENVFAVLKTIYDPEYPVNLVDLGLIYQVKIENDQVIVEMTLTNLDCPLATQFPEMIKAHLSKVPGVNSVMVNLVWDPPWSPDRMSEAARLELGI